MNNSIEMITEKGKVYIPDLKFYNSVKYEKLEFYNKSIEYRLILKTYLRYHDCEGITVTSEDEYYYFKTLEEVLSYYEKIKEILSRKVEDKEND